MGELEHKFDVKILEREGKIKLPDSLKADLKKNSNYIKV